VIDHALCLYLVNPRNYLISIRPYSGNLFHPLNKYWTNTTTLQTRAAIDVALPVIFSLYCAVLYNHPHRLQRKLEQTFSIFYSREQSIRFMYCTVQSANSSTCTVHASTSATPAHQINDEFRKIPAVPRHRFWKKEFRLLPRRRTKIFNRLCGTWIP